MVPSPPRPDLIVERLRPEQIRLAYPLIRAVDPCIRLQDWIRFARRRSIRNSANCGVLLARRPPQPNPLGVACYRSERRLSRRPILIAEYLTALDLLFPQQILHALILELDIAAAALDCDWVHFVCTERDRHLMQTLTELGHASDGLVFSRLVQPIDTTQSVAGPR